MSYVIRISDADWRDVRYSLFTQDGSENAGVLMCGTASVADEQALLVRRYIPVPPQHYVVRKRDQLEVAPAFYNEIISLALREKLSPVLIHSHPGHSEAWYSGADDRGEKRMLGVLVSLLPGLHPASLVVTDTSATGRLFNGSFVKLKGLSISGVRSEQICFSGNKNDGSQTSARYDRQIRAFGRVGQKILERLKIAVVGVGGIGSLVAEEVARAGVRNLILVDHDDIEETNLNRQFGATSSSVGKSKVEVTAENISRFGANKLSLIKDSAIRQSVLARLRDRDVIFLCVDNDRTRAILNRFSYQYIVPVIDHGMRLDGRGGRVTASSGRVTIVGPGMACLRCSNHLNSARIRAESMPREERLALQKEGYIMGIDEPAPAIVSLNTVVAGLGVTAAFNMFLAITGGKQPVDQIYDATSGTVFTVDATHDPACDVCSSGKGVKGIGDAKIVSAYD